MSRCFTQLLCFSCLSQVAVSAAIQSGSSQGAAATSMAAAAGSSTANTPHPQQQQQLQQQQQQGAPLQWCGPVSAAVVPPCAASGPTPCCCCADSGTAKKSKAPDRTGLPLPYSTTGKWLTFEFLGMCTRLGVVSQLPVPALWLTCLYLVTQLY